MFVNETNIELDLEILVQESSQSNYVSQEPLFPCFKVPVKKIGSSRDNNDKTAMYFYLLCFIDLLYFIKVLEGNKAIKKFC